MNPKGDPMPNQSPRQPIEIYSLDGCPACKLTERALSKAGITFDARRLEDHPEIADQAKKLGYSSAPVVRTDEDLWAGYNPARIKKLVQAHGPLNPGHDSKPTQTAKNRQPDDPRRGLTK